MQNLKDCQESCMMQGMYHNTEFVLHDVEEEEKVFHLCHHSEKLAIPLGAY
jgi:hypothetical protein